MRIWGWVLVIVLVVVGIGIWGANHVPSIPHHNYAPAPVAATSPQLQGHHAETGWRGSYHRHRSEFQRVAEYSQRARTERVVAVIGFAIFFLLTLPKNARDIRAFYRQLVAPRPLPPQAGESDDANRWARQVLFFYLLFLLYQVVQFPLTWGRDNTVQFISDLVFQFLLTVGVIVTFTGLKRTLGLEWKGDDGGRSRVKAVLDAKVEGIGLRWRTVPRFAVLMFVAAFTPALLTKLPDWLDLMSA